MLRSIRPKRATGRATSARTANTSWIERLNATFRSRLASPVRRGRGLVHKVEAMEAGMDLVGSVSNFCTEHRSLRMRGAGGEAKGQGRTPAMAAGRTDRV